MVFSLYSALTLTTLSTHVESHLHIRHTIERYIRCQSTIAIHRPVHSITHWWTGGFISHDVIHKIWSGFIQTSF